MGRRLGTVIASSALLAALVSAPAHAAFPGQNGKLVVQRTAGALEVMNPDGSGATPLGISGSWPAWSPDGTKLAFTRGDGLWVANGDGSDESRIVADLRLGTPTWSPDGTQIVYVQAPPFDPDCPDCQPDRFFRVDADGSDNTLIFTHVTVGSPAWSPEGSKLVFVGCSDLNCNQFGLWTMRPDGTDVVNIVGFRKNQVPDWAPDASKIAYYTVWSFDPPEERGLATVSPFGTGRTVINSDVFLAGAPAAPSWSPDGSRIALVDRELNCGAFCTFDVFTLDSDGSDLTQITNYGDVADVDWQPIPINTYVRPKGASPTRLSLVPAYQQCTSPNRTHGPPLAFASCNPPARVPGQLTIGTFDANGQPAKSVSYIRINPIRGNPATPADEADVRMRGTINDVRLASDLSDYTGNLEARLSIRITDKDNTPHPGGPGPATVQDFTHSQPLPCAATADTSVGSTCEFDTTVEALIPGAVKEQRRAIWELDAVRVHDGAGNLFLTQGIFVP